MATSKLIAKLGLAYNVEYKCVNCTMYADCYPIRKPFLAVN